MELLSRSLKIFLSLPRSTPGVRSLEMGESSQNPLENYGVGVDGEAYINKENSFPPPPFSELSLFGGHFFDNTQINSGKLSPYIKA